MRPHDHEAGPLDALGAIGLLVEHGLTHVAPHVAQLLVGSLGADPEAVLETAQLLTEEQLAGAALVPDPLPAVPAVRRAVAPALAGLSEDDRRVLLVAAVSVVDRTDMLLRASGTDLDALLAGPAVGCLDLVAGHARIHDPRVRSVVHDDATVAERTAAHRSLAVVYAADGQEDIATWHRALSCLAGEPEVSLPLIAVAERMLARGDAVWAQRVAREAASHAEGAARVRAVAVAGRAALHAGHVAEAADLLREALRTCEPEAAAALRTALLVTVSHLTGQVPSELVDQDGSPWSRLVAQVLHAARGEVASAREPSSSSGIEELDAGTRAIGEATLALLAGRVPPVLPSAPAADPVQGAMLGVLRAVALAADGQVDDARCALVTVLSSLAPLPGDRAWDPPEGSPADPDTRTCAMTPLVEAHVRLVEALVEMWAGNLEGGLAAVERASLRLPLGLCVHGAAAVVAGRASVLASGERGVLAAALERLVPLPQSPAVRTGVLTDQALVLLLHGEAPGAGTLLDLCDERSGPGGLPLPTLQAAEAHLVAGARPTAAAGVAAPQGLTAALMPGAHARLLVARGDLDRVDEALAATRAVTSPVEQGLTRLVVGQALVRAGRVEEGADHLRAAVGLLEGAGAGAVARLVRRLLGRTQVSPARLQVAGGPASRRRRRSDLALDTAWAGALTEREAEVAAVIADGTSNRVAARRLGLSERTVEVHLTSIFRKLGIGSRTELALLVSRAESAG